MSEVYTGLGASSGKTEGVVLLIDNPMVAPSAPKGSFIVVAEYTTPNLNLLLMNAKGVVCETGGMTMHASVISRELGIPSVMSVEGITSKVKSGQLISIDGTKGEVYVSE